MKRNLEQTLARFDAAEKVHTVASWIQWPEYDEYVASLRSLAKEAESLFLHGALREDYEKLWRIRRIVRTSPVEPSHVVAGIGLARLSALGAYGERLQQAFAALDALCATASPLITEIRAILSGERRLRIDAKSTVQILADRRCAPFYDPASICESDQYTVSLMSVSEARRSDMADVLFVLSDPEEHEHDGLKPWAARTRSMSWILNAPSARIIVCLLLNDSREFDVGRFEIWPGAGQFDAIIEGRRERIDLATDYVPPPFSEPTIIAPQPGDLTVDAIRFRLADGSTVYFSEKAGPSPRLLARDEFGVEILTPSSLGFIGRGSVVLVNASEASRNFINREAERLLREEHSPSAIREFREVVRAYKEALLAANVEDLIRWAKGRNLSEAYIRQQIQSAGMADTFATQDKRRFDIICDLVGLPVQDSQWYAVSRLQIANRMAGRTAKERLRLAIAEDESLYEQILEPSLVTVQDPELGAIIVSAVVDDPVRVTNFGVSNLGIVLP